MRLFLNSNERFKLNAFDELTSELNFERERARKAVLDNRELLILAKGCEKHPSYRAHRKPTAECGVCATMFLAGRSLLLEGYESLRGRKPGKKAKVV